NFRTRCLEGYGDASPTPALIDVSPSDVEIRVKRLVEGYRSLQTEHGEVVARYTADHRKWRRFKQWLLVGIADKERPSRSPLSDKVAKENVAGGTIERDADAAARESLSAAANFVQDHESNSNTLGKRRAHEDPSSPTSKRKAKFEGCQAAEEENNKAVEEIAAKPLQRRGRYAHY
ncbi:uncharacterized protein PHACADRAFT_144626, partial [Phanerochaete carnosa HHB-10118-sp]